jgi:hypothetical protein
LWGETFCPLDFSRKSDTALPPTIPSHSLSPFRSSPLLPLSDTGCDIDDDTFFDATLTSTEVFFDHVPDSQKIKLANGEVLHDTAIIKDFIPKDVMASLWKYFQACPTHDPNTPLPFNIDGMNPYFVSGMSKELNYRGNPMPRNKMWLQNDMNALIRYSYTGHQWGVSPATFLTSSIPGLDRLIDELENQTLFENPCNHFIVTIYENGKYHIGQHSDKVKDWMPGSCFVVIKFGVPRPFVFTQSIDGKDVVIFNQVLEAGTAIIVGQEANLRVKHGVPPVDDCGISGSIVGRCISTKFEWSDVLKKIESSNVQRLKRQEKKSLKSAINPKTEVDDETTLMLKLDKAGIDTLVKIGRDVFGFRLKNMKNSKILLKTRRDTIIGTIMKSLDVCDRDVKIRMLLDTFFPPKK